MKAFQICKLFLLLSRRKINQKGNFETLDGSAVVVVVVVVVAVVVAAVVVVVVVQHILRIDESSNDLKIIWPVIAIKR